ncbi:FadR/GntR family transcriptional regulator [Sulfitobacter sp. D35]|uniref:FadR/GntR family transcriptional regulator n=1 Tax=Sulfitobacter sp. D35 TaxID=3083252 RepID=UPI00296F5365|nr:FadR/GntR family transcriptional regulator [Sulfitobacter sp. D35]MDW4497189.1 FadR/GntR family transcriptional regulator [Sulfitobacter sp. D35]
MSTLDLPGGGRRYLQVAQSLADRIAAGTYKAGQRLPPERDLAAQLDVSRTTVREALLALEIMRYIEIRVGSGIFVLPEHLRDPDHGQLVVGNEVGPYEVLEVRRMIEGQSAYYAAQRASEAQLDAIGETLDRMSVSIHDIPAFDAADAEYHALIAAAAGNEVLETYVGHLWRMRESSLWRRWYGQTRTPENRRRSVEDHRTIYRALRRRRPEAAMSAMQLHIDVLTDRLLDLKLSPPDTKED